MTDSWIPSPKAIARARAFANRALSPEEFRAIADSPISAEELEETLHLIRWFRSRYPTAEARLAYVRRATRRWSTASPEI